MLAIACFHCPQVAKRITYRSLNILIPFIFACCREILQEIQRLRLQHEEASQPPPDKGQQNPTLLAELRLLRYLFQSYTVRSVCGHFCLSCKKHTSLLSFSVDILSKQCVSVYRCSYIFSPRFAPDMTSHCTCFLHQTTQRWAWTKNVYSAGESQGTHGAAGATNDAP